MRFYCSLRKIVPRVAIFNSKCKKTKNRPIRRILYDYFKIPGRITKDNKTKKEMD